MHCLQFRMDDETGVLKRNQQMLPSTEVIVNSL